VTAKPKGPATANPAADPGGADVRRDRFEPHWEPGYTLLAALVPPWVRLWFRASIEGAEHIPASGPAIVAANHLSYLDPLLVGWAVHAAGRRPRFLAKSELFGVPVVRSVLRSSGQIPVRRGTRDAAASLSEAEAALGRGECVLIFPEGTSRTSPELTPLPPKTGVARLALACRAPVIPCATWGGQWFWTKHLGVRPGPRKEMWIRFGRPMRFDDRPSPGGRDVWHEVAGEVMQEIEVLLAGARAAKPWPPTPPRRRYLEKQARKRQGRT
jgi:1-acyl-sn-glycerol-3-phosphate acyltransferase